MLVYYNKHRHRDTFSIRW